MKFRILVVALVSLCATSFSQRLSTSTRLDLLQKQIDNLNLSKIPKVDSTKGVRYVTMYYFLTHQGSVDTARLVMPWEMYQYMLKTDTGNFVMPWRLQAYMRYTDSTMSWGWVTKPYLASVVASFGSTGTAADSNLYAMRWMLSAYQPKGTYLTEEDDPTIYPWAKASVKPSYTRSDIGLATGSMIDSTYWRMIVLLKTDTTGLHYLKFKSLLDSIAAHKWRLDGMSSGITAAAVHDSLAKYQTDTDSLVWKSDIYTLGTPLALDSSMITAGRIFPLFVGNNEVVDTAIVVCAGAGALTMNLYSAASNFTASDSLLSAVWSVSATNGKVSKVTTDMRNSGSLGYKIWWAKITTVTTKPDALIVQLKGHRP